MAEFTIEAPEPDARGEEREFFDRCQQERLAIQRCTACERHVFYPRAACPYCGSTSLEWREATGLGLVHTFTVQFRPAVGYGEGPYVTAMIDLDEGVRMMARVIEAPDAVFVGQRVRVAFASIGGDFKVPVFVAYEPATASESTA